MVPWCRGGGGGFRRCLTLTGLLAAVALQSIHVANCSIQVWHDDWVRIADEDDDDTERASLAVHDDDSPPIDEDVRDDDDDEQEEEHILPPLFPETDASIELHAGDADANWQEPNTEITAPEAPSPGENRANYGNEKPVGVIYSADQHVIDEEPTSDGSLTAPKRSVVRCRKGRCRRLLRYRQRHVDDLSRLDDDNDRLQRQENDAVGRPPAQEIPSNGRRVIQGKSIIL
jgi:hypothetical protein